MKILSFSELKEVRGGALAPEPTPTPSGGGILGRVGSFFRALFGRLFGRRRRGGGLRG